MKIPAFKICIINMIYPITFIAAKKAVLSKWSKRLEAVTRSGPIMFGTRKFWLEWNKNNTTAMLNSQKPAS